MFHPLAQSESGNKKTALKRSSETQSRRKLFASLMFFVIVRCQHLLFYLPDIAILADDQPRVKAARAAELWKTPPRKIRANFQSPTSAFQTKKRARPAVKVQSLTLDVWGFRFKVCTKFFRACQLGAVWQSVPRDNRQFWC